MSNGKQFFVTVIAPTQIDHRRASFERRPEA